MSDASTTLLAIRGAMTLLPVEEQQKILVCHMRIRDAITDAMKACGEHGDVALAMILCEESMKAGE